MEDEEELVRSLFDDATQYVMVSGEGFTDQQKLEFYGYFKQATVGDCNQTRPPFYALAGTHGMGGREWIRTWQ